MLNNIDDTVRWLQLNKLEYWVVQLKDTDNTRVFESDESKTMEDNISLFRQVMEISRGSRYLLKAAYKKDDKRGKFFEEFKNLTDVQSDKPLMNGPHVGEAQIESIVEKRVSAEIDRFKKEQELELLRKERDEYKREAERRMGIPEKLMENLTPYVGTLAQYFISKLVPGTGTAPIAIAGIQQNDSISQNNTIMDEIILTDEQNERLENALQKWGNADADFLEYIEAFAEFAASGKKVMNFDYNTVKTMFGPSQLRNLMS